MSIASSSFSAGYTGCRVVSTTAAVTGRFRGFVVNADCVVSALLDRTSTSMMTSMGLTGVTLRQGMFISLPDDNWISSITLTSGSIILYNE
jgi:hypothetical protein